jgi:hypothetical protein
MEMYSKLECMFQNFKEDKLWDGEGVRRVIEPTVVLEDDDASSSNTENAYIKAFNSALANHQNEVETDHREIYERTLESGRFVHTGSQNKPEDLQRLLRVGRLVSDQEWRLLKKQALSVSAFLDLEQVFGNLRHRKSSLLSPFQKAMKAAKFEECESPGYTGEKPPLKEQNRYVGFVYLESDRALMKSVLSKVADALDGVLQVRQEKEEKRRAQEEKRKVKLEAKVKKEAQVKVEKKEEEP